MDENSWRDKPLTGLPGMSQTLLHVLGDKGATTCGEAWDVLKGGAILYGVRFEQTECLREDLRRMAELN